MWLGLVLFIIYFDDNTPVPTEQFIQNPIGKTIPYTRIWKNIGVLFRWYQFTKINTATLNYNTNKNDNENSLSFFSVAVAYVKINI